jgi:hypothetical protein
MNLFNGNITPGEQKPLEYPMRRYYDREFNKLREQLCGSLNEEEQALLSKLLDTGTSENVYSDIDAFIHGFRLAALLMVEVFHEKDGLLDDREQYLRHLLHRPFVGTKSALDDLG